MSTPDDPGASRRHELSAGPERATSVLALRSPTFQLADMLLQPDGLELYVQQKRTQGVSWRIIARDLWLDTGRRVEVTFETLRQWFPDDAQTIASTPEPKAVGQ